ncbi:ribonuclease H-like domain-containing protein [Tanacetum coccineum]|uniref:Ribonuclease H-like domain-containing protein n=1 Tax=Tanacetum coccineum TaxID=301880 RepID=A0ABQ5E1M4_9ASTR
MSIVLHQPDGVRSKRYHVVPYGELDGIPIAFVARFGLISKSTDRILQYNRSILELFRKLHDDVQNIHEELAEYINTPSWNRPTIYCDDDDDDDDDEDYTIAITPDLPITDSLIMKDKHLTLFRQRIRRKLTKSSVPRTLSKTQVVRGYLDNMLNWPFVIISPPIDISKEQLRVSQDSNDDSTSIDDDSFSIDGIDYVEASPPDSELVSLEVVEIVIPKSQYERFLSPNEFSILFIRDPLSSVFDTSLPFSSENEDNVFNPGILASNEEKSPHLLSHRCFKAFQLISEPAPIYEFLENYPTWEVIQNGNGLVSITTDTQGQIKVLPPRTVEEILARERERKARTTLLMALPEDHLVKFHKMTNAKEMWDAIKSRFGGNDESKKLQKYILKQQFKRFSVSTQKGFIKAMTVSLIMRTKLGVDSLSFDDLYNNLKVFENDVKGSTASSTNTQNIAFVSENTSSTNDTQPSESKTSKIDTCESNISSEPPELVSEPVVNESNIECQPKVWSDAPIIEEYESDSEDEHMTGNKAYLAEYQDYNGGPVAFGGSKGYISGKDTECLVLSPEFKLPNENQVLLRVPRQNNMYSFNLENIVPSGRLACLIAKATVDESNKWHRRLGHVNFKNLNKLVKGNLVRAVQAQTHREQLGDASIEIQAYTQALKKVEAQLVAHQQNQLWYEEKIRFMKIDLDDKTDVLTYHKKLLAEAEKEKEELKAKVEKWHNSSKSLNILLNSQMSARDKAGLGYGDQMNKGVLSFENEVFGSIWIGRSKCISDSPVYNRIARGCMQFPLQEGIYIPSGPDKEIDD